MGLQDRINWFKNTHNSEQRTNSVGIDWYILSNHQLVELGIAPKYSVENWTDMFMFEEDSNEFKEKYYLNQLLSVFFQNENRFDLENVSREQKRKNIRTLLKIRDTFNKGKFGNWIIYTPVGNKIHTALKSLLENIVDTEKYVIAIMDGGDEERSGVSNASCEEIMLNKSIAAAKDGKQMIFISSMMGIRSWSNKYVKNILFLHNGGSADVIGQKAARGFTPCGEEIKCKIYDFRLEYNYPVASSYLAQIIMAKNEDSELSTNDVNKFLEKIIGSDKIEFWDVYGDSMNPIRKLNETEVHQMMYTPSFIKYQVNNYLYEHIDINLFNVKFPDTIKLYGESSLSSENDKGDSSRKERTINVKLNKGKSEKEYNILQKYIEYIFSNGKELNFKLYETNIIKHIYEDLKTNETEYKDFIKNVIGLNYEAIKEILVNLYKSGIETDKVFYPY